MSALENLIASMSVAQLAEMAGMDVESMVTLVLERGGRGTAAPKAKGRRGGRKKAEAAEGEAATQAAPAKKSGSGHNTRTKAGRDALDAAILEFLGSQSDPVRALDIRKGVGGTSAQVRTRLNYLISQSKVAYKGRASGTRYWTK